jgi:hypothetical protein
MPGPAGGIAAAKQSVRAAVAALSLFDYLHPE